MDPSSSNPWRAGRVGDVPVRSARGVAALVLFGMATLVILLGPIVLLVEFLRSGRPAETEGTLTGESLLIGLAFNALLLLVIPLIALAVTRPNRPGSVWERLQLELQPRTLLHIVLGFVAAGLFLLILGAALLAIQKVTGAAPEESALLPQIQGLLTWPLVFIISITAAVTEEVYFRGILQPRVGIIASSLLFGLVHIGYGTALQVIVPFLLGAVLGLLMRWTKSLWTPIAAHFGFDFIQLSALLMTRDA